MGKDQPDYLPLPAYKSREGIVLSCWRPTWWERLKILFIGRIWVMNHTYNDPLQPQCLSADSPFAVVGEQKSS